MAFNTTLGQFEMLKPSLLKRLTPGPSQDRKLLCFPHSGAGPLALRRFAVGVGDGVDVWSVALPGREHRLAEPPLSDFNGVVHAVCDAVQESGIRDLALLGHSFGAALAFEVAMEFQRRQAGLLRHLFVCAFRAPQAAPTNGAVPPLHSPQFLDLIRAIGGVSEEALADVEFRDRFLPAIHADLSMAFAYSRQPIEQLHAPITAFYGIKDERVGRRSMSGWTEHTEKSFEICPVAGDHFFIKSTGCVAVSKVVKQALAG